MKKDNKISVMIVEDSRVVREFLEDIISRDGRFRILHSVATGEEALSSLQLSAPDIISMDIRLPGMNGLELTQRIMREHPTPIVVVSSDLEDSELKISMNALRAGALAVVQKPVGVTHSDYEKLAESLCNKLAIMSEVTVIQQRAALQKPLDIKGTGTNAPSSPYTCTPAVVGIVASTGGPNALVRVINDLSPELPVPILVVQHITPSFLHGFVSWLGDVVKFPVVVAQHGQSIERGTIYVAAPDYHLELANRERLILTNTPPVCLQRPSGSVLLSSIARSFGPKAVGVVLTGMGEDGASGLTDIQRAGGYTIAEDESTAVVYGMPAVCVRLGAVRESLPLPEIGSAINRLMRPYL